MRQFGFGGISFLLEF